MKVLKVTISLMLLCIVYSCSLDQSTTHMDSFDEKEPSIASTNPSIDYFAIANRGMGTVSIYDAKSTDKLNTVILGGENPAPTYVTYSKVRDLLYIADFNNPRVVVYDVGSFEVEQEFRVGNGAFHMWINDEIDQLWVNNIVDKTTSVVSLETGNELARLSLPEEISFAEDAAQHDVIISPDGQFAYVSIFSTTGDNFVLQYRTDNFSLMNAAIVGGDPHLTVTNDHLYILSQDDSNIREYEFGDLTFTGKEGSVDNAHGVTPGEKNDIFVTNISGRQVAAYNTSTTTVDRVTDTESTSGVAHNLAFNPNQNILAVTLSGSNTVDFFKVNKNKLKLIGTDVSGGNPFGIVFIDR